MAEVPAPLQTACAGTEFTEGVGVITTFWVAVADVQPFTTTYNEYTPPMAGVAFPMFALVPACVQPNGPDQ